MKDGLNYALFGTVVAVAAGLIGAYGIPDGSQTETSSFASAQMLGHVTYTLTDSDGNIKAYRQLDNIIVDHGEDCAARLLFSNSSSGYVVTDGSINGITGTGTTNTCWFQSDPFVTIAIGNGSKSGSLVAADTDTALQQEHNQTGTGFLRFSDTFPAFNAATGGSPASVVLSKDFTLDTTTAGTGQTGTQPADVIVNESGLFNQTTVLTPAPLSDASVGNGMFARQTFADVTVGDGESLTVEWTINIGGTGTFNAGEET